MQFHHYFQVCEFAGGEVGPLSANHPLRHAVQVAGSLHQPTVLLTEVQRPAGHARPVDVLWWGPGLTSGNGMFIVDLRTPPQVLTMVKISSGALTQELSMTTAHELGHVMDHLLKVHLIGSGHVTAVGDLYASEARRPELEAWWAAVQASQLYKVLHRTQGFHVHFGSITPGLSDDSPAECFACSFAQLVATDSGDATFRQELGIRQNVRSPRYWPDEAFVPIGAALRNVFNQLGW